MRLGALLPRLAIVAALLLGASATLTYAAQQRVAAAGAAPSAPAPVVQQTLRVPDVRGQAYVFAKGILDDAGFAWRVGGSVGGFATNLVASQSPAAGSKVIDTGAPTVTLTLVRNRRYKQHGEAENAAPYEGTSVLVTSGTAAPKTSDRSEPEAAAAAPDAPEQAAVPAAAAPTATVGSNVPSPTASPRLAGPERAKSNGSPKPAGSTTSSKQNRPPAFAVSGAPKEPLDELALPERARKLQHWLESHRRPTDANVRHWLYQHAWIVTGAKFGWWHGAEALRILVAVDRRVEAQWGIGKRSELAARRALVAVEANSK